MLKRGLSILCIALLPGAVALAEPPPWGPAHGVPLPSQARSLEVQLHDAPILSSPFGEAKRRGSAQGGARLPIFGWQAPHATCNGRWFLVGPEAWLCEANARLSTWLPQQEPLVRADADGLPYRYHFVGPDGSFGYASLRLAEEGVPDSQLEPSFAVAITRTENKRGEAYGLTSHGFWLPMRDLRPASVPSFRGVHFEQAERSQSNTRSDPPSPLDIAWVHKAEAAVYRKPHYRTKERLPKFSRVDVLERQRRGGADWYRIGEERWVRGSDVRKPPHQEAPATLLPGERWLSVDTESQTLVAYEGTRPVFATLVSTGKGAPDTATATPRGAHRIWVKLISTDMTNLEQEEAHRYYAIEEVPWVMFFKGGYGLHGAFWHSSFGTRRSHGCVNLSPKDAQFLFAWAGPRLPLGWHAAHPTRSDRGTLVIVH